jgi:DedD protein
MPAENGMPENEDVRKKALLRLGVAGLVTAAALGGLWWLDQGGGESKKPAPQASAPAPIIAAPAPEAPPAPETSVPEATAPKQETTAAPGGASVESAPPPPRVDNTPKTARTPPSTHQAAPLSVPAPSPQAQPQPAVAPQPAPGLGKGYVVQLGVFTNPDYARDLVDKLNKQGVRAHLETRVQVGPFLNRQEAEKAQAEMRKLGYNALVTLPYPALPAMK